MGPWRLASNNDPVGHYWESVVIAVGQCCHGVVIVSNEVAVSYGNESNSGNRRVVHGGHVTVSSGYEVVGGSYWQAVTIWWSAVDI